MNKDLSSVARNVGLVTALLFISGVILAIEQPWVTKNDTPPPPSGLPEFEKQFPAAPGFTGATGWVNSPALKLESLRGQVVLVDFWTYSCINCIHTFPYVEGWFEKYNASGFTVIGVHTPEFRFERDVANIQHATKMYGLTYPVAVDSDYGVWNAYNNHYWPAEYLIDAYGRVRHTSFGEGNYDETESVLRELLGEAGHGVGEVPTLNATAPAQAGQFSPELYASDAGGADRMSIANAEGYHPGQDTTYMVPADLAFDKIYLVGTWRESEESVTAISPDARVLVKFNAGGANVVLDAPRGSCLAVKLDGAPIAADRSAKDVDRSTGAPCMFGDGARSYDFYAGPLEAHTVDIAFPTGASLYTFDFAAAGRT